MSGHSRPSNNREINSDCARNTEGFGMQNMGSTPEDYSHWLRALNLDSPNPIRSSVPGFQEPSPFPLPTNQSVSIPSDLDNNNIPESLWMNDGEHCFKNIDLPTAAQVMQFMELYKDSLDDLAKANEKTSAEDDKAPNASTLRSPGFSVNSSSVSERIRSSTHDDNNCRGNDLKHLDGQRQELYQHENPCANSHAIQQAKLQEFIFLAMHGGEIGAKLAKHHHRRPCFKKIDTLCSRMKQDLLRNDGILANINSQGIPWAVKDFIFIFTRVISSWSIMKGYIYNTPEELDKVQSAYSPGFIKSFLDWQDSTHLFVDNLIKSFVNLDNLVQSQKHAFHKPEKNSPGNYSPSRNPCCVGSVFKDNIFPKNNDCLNPLDVESPKRPINFFKDGAYLRTGLYIPPTKVRTSDLPPVNEFCRKAFNYTSRPHTPLEESRNENTFDGLSSLSNNVNCNCPINGAVSMRGINDLHVPDHNSSSSISQPVLEDLASASEATEKNQLKTESSSNWARTSPLDIGLDQTFKILLNRVSSLIEAKYFLTENLILNYFPDFATQYPFIFDLRTIVLKTLMNGYESLSEIIHDLKVVIYCAKMYLMTNENVNLKTCIRRYEDGINNVLKEKPFQNRSYDLIVENPNQPCFKTTI